MGKVSKLREAFNIALDEDIKNMYNRQNLLSEKGLKMSKIIAETTGHNPRVQEDEQRALKGLINELESMIRDKGYTIETMHDGTASIIHKEGPYPNAIIALTQILKKEGMLP
jgi:hypothetical protein